jgi:hypothetical protein
MGAGSEATIAGDDWLGSSPDRRGGPEKDVMSFGKIPSALLFFSVAEPVLRRTCLMETALLQSIRAVDDVGAGRRGCVSWMPDDDEGRARAADRMRRHAPPTGAITRY